MTTLSASLTNITILLHQSYDFIYYVSRRILTPPRIDWINTELHTHDFASSPDFSRQRRLAKITCAWSWRICGITPAGTDERNWYQQGIEKLIVQFDKCRNWCDNSVGKCGMRTESILTILARVMDKKFNVQSTFICLNLRLWWSKFCTPKSVEDEISRRIMVYFLNNASCYLVTCSQHSGTDNDYPGVSLTFLPVPSVKFRSSTFSYNKSPPFQFLTHCHPVIRRYIINYL